ncbi:unnamed protein product [marine sediment metagenome]|uniref:Uncharacterized protein n=1 Tax=marine sediment metagenome TaxID=412755 RepID=X1RK82_9ZZZZ
MGKHYGLDALTLHELRIDVDKEWADEAGQPRGITNLKELASGMQKGDTFFRQGGVLVKLSPGSIGDELTSGGPGNAIQWKAPPGL